MLSFTEFKRKEKKEASVDAVFSRLEDDIAGIYVDSTRIKEITQICAEWAESVIGSEKTLKEHQILRNLPETIRDMALDGAADARKIVKRYKCQLVEQYDAIDNAEIHIDRLLNKLKDDLITNFGVSSPAQMQQPQQQQPRPLTWWDRLKRWGKGLWYGPGDPNMRQYAKEQGYAGDDYYSKYESIDPENFQILFEGVIKESIATLVQILNKYKSELLDVV